MTTHSKAVACLLLLLCLSRTLTFSQAVSDSVLLPGVQKLTLTSAVLNEKRTVRIYAPANMDRYSAYPVLYVLDGETLATMVGGQVQYLSESYKVIPNLIVVGIENTNRMRDLTPTQPTKGPDGKLDTSANSPFKNTGGGERFLQFIKTELMPFVETRYHTAPYKILAGHSLGGLMAVHCLVNHPEYFNAYIAISPSLQWDNSALLKQIEKAATHAGANKRLLFFSDANEDAAFHQNQLALDSLLKRGNLNLSYKRLFYPEESHISEPVKAFYDGIRYVYPAWHLPYNTSSFRKTMTAKIIMAHYQKLSEQYGYNVMPQHDDLNQIARFLRNDPERIQDAIDLLELNARHYPASAVVQELLGDVWLKKGDRRKAYACYQKALELAPDNETFQQKRKSTQN